jgi:hypothetical protein
VCPKRRGDGFHRLEGPKEQGKEQEKYREKIGPTIAVIAHANFTKVTVHHYGGEVLPCLKREASNKYRILDVDSKNVWHNLLS